MCDRKWGIGADGLVLIKPFFTIPVVRFYNADGSEAEMCVNAIRCIGNFLKQIYPERNTFQLKLAKRIIGVKIKKYSLEEKRALIEINIGKPCQDYYGEKFPSDRSVKINLADGVIEGYYVCFDNPHFVIFTSLENKRRLEETGKKLQKIFKHGINVEFTEARNAKEIDVLFWERGVGWTDSCGSGSCAVAVILKKHKFLKDKNFHIRSMGQVVKVKITSDFNTFLEGEAWKVFEGYIE